MCPPDLRSGGVPHAKGLVNHSVLHCGFSGRSLIKECQKLVCHGMCAQVCDELPAGALVVEYRGCFNSSSKYVNGGSHDNSQYDLCTSSRNDSVGTGRPARALNLLATVPVRVSWNERQVMHVYQAPA